MIRTNISRIYSHHILNEYNENIFVVDYTEKTKFETIRRSVEIFSPTPPGDNSYFSLFNNNKLIVNSIIFDNTSFTYTNGNAKSQCENTCFPKFSDEKSWILFTELKYSSKPLNNENNLKKAIKQLFKTRYHYLQSGIFRKNQNTSYLIASLPLQREPFSNFSLTQVYLSSLKTKHNIILRLKNSVEVINNSIIIV